MAKKPAEDPQEPQEPKTSKDLWIAPRYSLKGPAGERAWENRPGGPPNSSRYLELADIALGTQKPGTKKKKPPSSRAHQVGKTEPYSSVK